MRRPATMARIHPSGADVTGEEHEFSRLLPAGRDLHHLRPGLLARCVHRPENVLVVDEGIDPAGESGTVRPEERFCDAWQVAGIGGVALSDRGPGRRLMSGAPRIGYAV